MPPKNDWNHTDIRSSYWNISGMWMMSWIMRCGTERRPEAYWRRPHLKRWIISEKLRYKRLNIKSRSPYCAKPYVSVWYDLIERENPMGPCIVTAALTGVLTNPTRHNVPVTPEEMAAEAKAAQDAGATVVHFTSEIKPRYGSLADMGPRSGRRYRRCHPRRGPQSADQLFHRHGHPDISGPLGVLRRVKPRLPL